jgi:hypothetical protein
MFIVTLSSLSYQSNVFYIFPKHCFAECDLSVSLTAILFMKDYPKDYQSPPEDDVPLFYSFEYDQEKKSFILCQLYQIRLSNVPIPLKG